MFGGSHFSTELLYKLQEILLEIEEDFIIFAYKISGESHKNIKFMSFKDNFLEYLKASKGIITQAGHLTLSECVALKIPSLMFPIPNYIEQELNAFFAQKKGISIIKENRDYTKDEFLEIINNFISSIPQLKANLEKLNIETNGAEQAAAIISKSLSAEK